MWNLSKEFNTFSSQSAAVTSACTRGFGANLCTASQFEEGAKFTMAQTSRDYGDP